MTRSIQDTDLPDHVKTQIRRICRDFEAAWRADERPRVEVFLGRIAAAAKTQLLFELIKTEVQLGESVVGRPQASAYHRRFPEFTQTINQAFSDLDLTRSLESGQRGARSSSSSLASQSVPDSPPVPKSIGKYTVKHRQKETKRGRAEIRLAERTSLWISKSERKQLPSWWEWVNIRLYTEPTSWSESQDRMMRSATRHHAVRMLCLAALLVVVATTAITTWSHFQRAARIERFEGLVGQLWNIDIEHLPGLVDQLDEQPAMWEEEVARVAGDPTQSPAKRTRGYIALARRDDAPLDYLQRRLLMVDFKEHRVIRSELGRWKQRLLPRLWARTRNSNATSGQVLRAASTLAMYDADNPAWKAVADVVVRSMVSEDPLLVGTWVESLRPVRRHLMQPLVTSFQAATIDSDKKLMVASILGNYGAGDVAVLPSELLAELIVNANESQYSVLAPVVLERASDMQAMMERELDQVVPLTHDFGSERSIARQASAAEVLLRLGEESTFWPLLAQREDPRLRSVLIERVHRAADWRHVLEGLTESDTGGISDPSIRQALVLALNGFQAQITAEDHERIATEVLGLYVNDRDPGVHSAAEWLLKTWGYSHEVERAKVRLARQPRGQRNWFINDQLHTMIVIRRPGRFTIGSPDDEPGRDDEEVQRSVEVDYSFAISAHEVTVAQFLKYYTQTHGDDTEFEYAPEISPEAECPMNKVSWYDAARYCRWLSEQEPGFSNAECCYPEIDAIHAGMSFPDNYLRREGYRLPTAAEWEHAARAGSVTSRFFGNDETQLTNFAWYGANSKERTWPVGQKMPNSLGLFDMYGNVTEWSDAFSVRLPDNRVLRGGHYRATPRFLRSAWPRAYRPPEKISIAGFRVVQVLSSE